MTESDGFVIRTSARIVPADGEDEVREGVAWTVRDAVDTIKRLEKERDAARAALCEMFDVVPMNIGWLLGHPEETARWRKAAGE